MPLPTPYFQTPDGAITLYHGECRDILPQIEQGELVVVTDPPYGINLNTDNSRFSGGNVASETKRGNGVGTGRGIGIIGDSEPFDPSFLLAYGGMQIIWGWNHFGHHLPVGTCLVWIKRNEPAFGSFLSDAEVAWMSTGHGVYCKRDLSNNAIARQRVHPTQKPVTLMKWCLGFGNQSATIVDPFAGSGTTLVSAQDLGRRAIGIEIEERYCEIAAGRLGAMSPAHDDEPLLAAMQEAPA
jgi:site-specific DNA-methyltransferase (adenine-specific)